MGLAPCLAVKFKVVEAEGSAPGARAAREEAYSWWAQRRKLAVLLLGLTMAPWTIGAHLEELHPSCITALHPPAQQLVPPLLPPHHTRSEPHVHASLAQSRRPNLLAVESAGSRVPARTSIPLEERYLLFSASTHAPCTR